MEPGVQQETEGNLSRRHPGTSVLDVGCGSRVLSVWDTPRGGGSGAGGH